MKIFIHDIPEEGLVVVESLDQAFLSINDELTQALEKVGVKACVSITEGRLIVLLDVSTGVQLTCSRCLAKTRFVIEKKDLLLTYPIHQEKTIDLTEDIREAIIIDLPIKPLCSPTCKGLCQHCGANLNQAMCLCKKEEEKQSSPFSILDKIEG